MSDDTRKVETRARDKCLKSTRADGAHSWQFDGDDPYVVCANCYERRDTLTGQTVVATAHPPQEAVSEEGLDVFRAAIRDFAISRGMSPTPFLDAGDAALYKVFVARPTPATSEPEERE